MPRQWVSSQVLAWQLHRDVVDERNRQVHKWGVQHHAPEMWALVLTEEVGEFAQAILDLRLAVESPQPTSANERAAVIADGATHMHDELVQCAAVCLAALADLDGTHTTAGNAKIWPTVPNDADPARWWENGKRADDGDQYATNPYQFKNAFERRRVDT